MPDGQHTYYPDVFINNNEIHEIKPKWKLTDEKIIAEKFCNIRNWKYKIISENELNIIR